MRGGRPGWAGRLPSAGSCNRSLSSDWSGPLQSRQSVGGCPDLLLALALYGLYVVCCVITAMAEQVKSAVAEGDIRADLDPVSVAEVVVSALLGARDLQPEGGNDLVRHITTVWEILLPALVTGESLEYFREYLARATLRHLG